MFHTVGNGEDEGEGHLRHAVGAVGRNVGYDNAAFFGGLDVDHIEACGLYADVFESGQFCDGLSIHLYFVDEDDVGVFGTFHLFGIGCAGVDSHITQLLECIPVEVAWI